MSANNTTLSTQECETVSPCCEGLDIFMVVVMFPVIIISGFGNSVLFLCIYRKPAMWSYINILLATLALCDLLITVLCMPFEVISLISRTWIFGHAFCHVHSYILSVLQFETAIILLFITIDRYCIIVRRIDTMTARHAKLYLGLSLLISCIISLPIVADWPFEGSDRLPQTLYCKIQNNDKTTAIWTVYGVLHFCFCYSIPFQIMGLAFWLILRKTKKLLVKVNNINAPVINNPAVNFTTRKNRRISLAKMRQHSAINTANIDMRFKSRTFTTVLMIFALFLVFKLPFGISCLVWTLNGDCSTGKLPLLLWFFYISSAINPIIYGVRIKKFREECKEVCPWIIILMKKKIRKQTSRRVKPGTIYRVDSFESPYITQRTCDPC